MFATFANLLNTDNTIVEYFFWNGLRLEACLSTLCLRGCKVWVGVCVSYVGGRASLALQAKLGPFLPTQGLLCT